MCGGMASSDRACPGSATLGQAGGEDRGVSLTGIR